MYKILMNLQPDDEFSSSVLYRHNTGYTNQNKLISSVNQIVCNNQICVFVCVHAKVLYNSD